MRGPLWCIALCSLFLAAGWLWLHGSPASRQFNRGLEARQRGAWAEAEEHFTACLADESFPRRAEAFSVRATTREKLSRLGEAMEDHHKAVELAPNNANIRVARGVTRGTLGDLRGALEDYTAAVAANPSCVQARYNRGSLLWSLGRRDEAEPELKEAVRLDPTLANRVAELKAREP